LRYRSREGIMADLLTAVMRSNGDGEGVGIATIIRKGNVPYPRALEMLRSLVHAGLVVEVNSGEKIRYAVTQDGFRYLATYRDFEGFARSFGLRL
jgi:predicted transcriptional regulator